MFYHSNLNTLSEVYELILTAPVETKRAFPTIATLKSFKEKPTSGVPGVKT